jgi:hypothetical protein
LLDMHEINAYWADHVCLSVRMIQLENRWTDLDEIWCGRFAIEGYHKLLLFNNIYTILSLHNFFIIMNIKY